MKTKLIFGIILVIILVIIAFLLTRGAGSLQNNPSFQANTTSIVQQSSGQLYQLPQRNVYMPGYEDGVQVVFVVNSQNNNINTIWLDTPNSLQYNVSASAKGILPKGHAPIKSIQFTPDNKFMYVITETGCLQSGCNDTYYAFNTTTFKMVNNFSVCCNFDSIAFSQDNKFAYIGKTSPLQVRIDIVNLTTGKLLSVYRFNGNFSLMQMISSPNGKYIYGVTLGPAVWAINATNNKIIVNATGPGGNFSDTHAVGISNNSTYLYIIENFNLYVYDTLKNMLVSAGNLAVRGTVQIIVIPNSNYAYLSGNGGQIEVIYLSNLTVRGLISAPGFYGLLDEPLLYPVPNSGYLYVVRSSTNMISVLNTTTDKFVSNFTLPGTA